jgi:hypothetical protein
MLAAIPPIRRLSLLAAALAVVLSAVQVDGQSSPLPRSTGAPLLLKVPPAALTTDANSIEVVTTFTGTVDHDPSAPLGLAVDGRSDWKARGFPSLLPFTLEKITRQDNYTEAVLRSGKTTVVKLRFLPSVRDVTAAYAALVAPDTPDERRALRRDSYDAIARAAFEGQPFASMPVATQRTYLEWANLGGARSVAGTFHHDKPYLEVDLGRQTSVYDPFGFSKEPLVARLLNDHLLMQLRTFPDSGKAWGMEGVRLSMQVLYRSYLDGWWVPSTFDLDVIAPAGQIRRWAAGDLSDREFLAACAVLVNDTGFQVSLAPSARH